MRKASGLLLAALLLAAGGAGAEPGDRRALFGDLHLHTGFSPDAWALFATHGTPADAYRFAKGQPMSAFGRTLRRPEPLDFLAVTDHSEFMGTLKELDDPNSEFARSEAGRQALEKPMAGFQLWAQRRRDVPGFDPDRIMRTAWQRTVEAANQANEPGRFTAFFGYEWSSMGPSRTTNLHRNVIFAGSEAPPVPFSSDMSARPEDLWAFQERLRQQGIETVAISHNANASGGLMFDWNDSDGRPIDRAYAARRIANEPLTEIVQSKGQSDTVPELSPNDEFAGFEIFDSLLTGGKSKASGGYVREALGRGLVIQGQTGANPFKMGTVGGTDIHLGLSTGREEDALVEAEIRIGDAPAGADPFQAMRSSGRYEVLDPLKNSSGALTGVWAEENTRASIFAALRRKETFATSGPRIQVRFFGGWSYPGDLTGRGDWVKRAYAGGVSMGNDLPARGPAKAPRFVLWAAKDPNGANLDRLQIVKVWLSGNSYRERVYDVAASDGRRADRYGTVAPVGNTVDIRTATYANSIGAGQLSAVWQDPDFDPGVAALYYPRILEIPTPRWTTILAARRQVPPPAGVAATVQERAWASPIWYTP